MKYTTAALFLGAAVVSLVNGAPVIPDAMTTTPSTVTPSIKLSPTLSEAELNHNKWWPGLDTDPLASHPLHRAAKRQEAASIEDDLLAKFLKKHHLTLSDIVDDPSLVAQAIHQDEEELGLRSILGHGKEKRDKFLKEHRLTIEDVLRNPSLLSGSGGEKRLGKRDEVDDEMENLMDGDPNTKKFFQTWDDVGDFGTNRLFENLMNKFNH
jgi:hypothetical protein